MRRIIAIADEDYAYATALAAFINDTGNAGLRAVPFKSIKAYETSSKYEICISLISESLYLQEPGKHYSGILILMSSDGFSENASDVKTLFKYKRADKIFRELMNYYSGEEKQIKKSGAFKSHITAVYSPVGRSGKTALAVTLGLIHSMTERTLLITLDEYAGIFRYISAEADSDMSDTIFALKQGNVNWSRIVSKVFSFGRLDYIPPVRYPDDLTVIKPHEMKELILNIASDGGYEEIVIDTGSYGKRSAELFDICDALYMPVSDDEISDIKTEEFNENLIESGREEIAERFVRVRLPLEKKDISELIVPDFYLKGILFEYAAGLISEHERGMRDE